jgi:hypothetical protein
MSISINNNNGIIDIIQSGAVPRSYFRCGGNSKAIGTDYIQIIIDKDTYSVLWSELNIGGYTPESQYAALYMLAQVFAGVPVNPPAPPPTTLKVNPQTINTFDIPENTIGSVGDFTIEWLQYMHTENGFPRVYSIGQYPAQNAVSIEGGGTLYLWLNGSLVGNADITSYGYLNNWLHIVITRYKSEMYVWLNGINLIQVTYPNAIPTNGLDFYIGSENANDTYYNGLISNFRWTTGVAVYFDTAPDYPILPLSVYPGTVLLIGLGNDITEQTTDQTGINTITNTNCTFNSDSGISGNSDGSIQFGTI